MNLLNNLLTNPKHDSYYMVDANMIVGYIKNYNTVWNNYVDTLSKKGKRFFVLPRIAKEINQQIPPEFTVLSSNYDCDVKLKYAYQELLNQLNISNITKFETDSKWLLESGFCSATNDDIPYEAFFKNQVFAITANASLIRKIIKRPENRVKIEKIVDDHGLEHLIDIRYFDFHDGSFADYK